MERDTEKWKVTRWHDGTNYNTHICGEKYFCDNETAMFKSHLVNIRARAPKTVVTLSPTELSDAFPYTFESTSKHYYNLNI